MSILLSRKYFRTLRFPWLQKVKFRYKLNPWGPKELWNSKWEMELPCSNFLTSLPNTFLGNRRTCTDSFFALGIYYFFFRFTFAIFFTNPANSIYFLTSWVRFHRFHFFSVYTNQLLPCIMYHYIVKSSKEYLTCNLQLQGADFPASPFIPASPLLPLSPFSP